MTTFPLNFPDVSVSNSSFRLISSSVSTMSPFSGARKAYDYMGQWWEGEVTFIPTRREDAALIQAFITKLRGVYGSFLYADPDALALGHQGAGGTILVNGAGQTGNTLIVDNMTNSTTVAKAGDYFQLGTGASSRLYMFTENLVSNGSGQGTATFEPSLRTSPADNTQLDITSPMGVFALTSSDVGWSSNQSSIYEITLSFREVL